MPPLTLTLVIVRLGHGAGLAAGPFPSDNVLCTRGPCVPALNPPDRRPASLAWGRRGGILGHRCECMNLRVSHPGTPLLPRLSSFNTIIATNTEKSFCAPSSRRRGTGAHPHLPSLIIPANQVQ
ncbi:hypothetical protein B0H16DRAFT_43508 [Mycena metata]|uniref:Secreted protein n=1 Tax=Mycena metata TaxID=1033252 RepID=A0AAD7NU89_9AGAR|nr:hypothetical protein B0H16DRAFT_43508 [Mycena metata]